MHQSKSLRVRDEIHCTIVELDYPEFKSEPHYKRRVMLEEVPRDGQERRVFYPLYGRKANLEALSQKATVFTYQYKPYVDIDWYINYLQDEQELEMYVLLCFVRDDVRSKAELEKEN